MSARHVPPLPRMLAALAEGSARCAFDEDEGLVHEPAEAIARDMARSAGALRELGPRETPVALCAPNGRELMVALCGAWWAGRPALVLPTPRPFSDPAPWARDVQRLVARTGATLLAMSEGPRTLFADATGDAPPLALAALLQGPPTDPVDVQSAEVALLQCTSGSSGTPKVAQLSFDALMAHAVHASARMGCSEHDTMCFWVPLYHDMALGLLLGALLRGSQLVLLPTERFATDPVRWFDVIEQSRATQTGAPPFAYELAAKRLHRRLSRGGPGADLSSLRTAAVGAEPIPVARLRALRAQLHDAGMRAPFIAGYGLAEATCVVTMTPPGTDLVSCRVRGPLAPGLHVLETGEEDPAGIEIASCGPPLDGTAVRVRRDDGGLAPSGEVGHIEVRTPAMMSGYLDAPEDTAAAFTDDGWLRTGDLGFLLADELYVAGRCKDVIIVRGRNVLPEEVEAVAAEVEGVRSRQVVVFGEVDPAGGPERVCLLVVPQPDADEEDLARRLREAVSLRVDLMLDDIIFVSIGDIPRTSSGKVRRGEARVRWGRGS